MKGTLALRFDVDSVRCIEDGIPSLSAVARKHGVLFTYFVNMGYSFNWTHTFRHAVRKRLNPPSPDPSKPVGRPLSALEKLGIGGILKTMFLNPKLGDWYRDTFDQLFHEGHELALHGGTDHAIWQRSLHELSEKEIRRLFLPAYEKFSSRYGKPAGFAAPGFVYNDTVLDLLDEFGFEYSSDMLGEEPFRTATGEGRVCDHYQVPVNVIGTAHVPIIEEMLSAGTKRSAIVKRCVEEIRSRRFSLLYGHPFVEGVHSDILDRVIAEVQEEFEIVPMRDFLRRWKENQGG